jgi:hypothetical protein
MTEQLSVTVEGATYYHTSESLAALIKEATENRAALSKMTERYNEKYQLVQRIRGDVYELFSSNYSSGDEDITLSVEDINELLRSIGADELKRNWSATVQVYLTITGIEASNQEEATEIVENNIEVSYSEDGDLFVDEITVQKVTPE